MMINACEINFIIAHALVNITLGQLWRCIRIVEIIEVIVLTAMLNNLQGKAGEILPQVLDVNLNESQN